MFAELVEFIEDRWGKSDVWANAHNLVADFDRLDAVEVWAAVNARITGDPEKARFAPKPAEVIAGALERMRHRPRPALPRTTERYSWKEYSERTYGEVIPLSEAIERRAEELAAR